MKLTLSSYWTSVVRTLVPLVVGWLLAWPLTIPILRWLGINAADGRELTGFLTALFGIAYYLAVRGLERWKPSLGRLLGVPAPPDYGWVSNIVTSIVRTAIPYLVGYALSLPFAPAVLAVLGIHGSADQVRAAVTVALIGVYYSLVRKAELRWPNSWVGILLGSSVTPRYPALARPRG